MKRKKIIIIGPAYPLRGGIADSNHALAMALQKLGHEVHILSFSLQYPNFLFPGKTQYELNGVSPDIPIHSRINSIHPYSWYKAAIWLRNQNPDLIITRFWIPFMGMALGTILRWSGLKHKIPFIAFCDNVIPHEKRWADTWLTKYFLKTNNRFLVMSHSVAEDLSEFIKNPTVAIHPHPVYDHFGALVDREKALNRLGLDSSKKYLLFFGFIRKYKGLDLLIEALSKLSEQVELIVAGEFYDDSSEYVAQVQQLQLSDKVHFFSNFIPKNEVNLYFSACDMVVQPYRTATQSGVAQIGYHFNKPMLVTHVGGLPEMVPHQKVGYVVDVNAQAIADAIDDFYQENRSAYFTENVAIEKKKYSWSNMAKQILKGI